MSVRQMMTGDPEACLPQETLNVVGDIMRRRVCGFVPVIDGRDTRRVIGVITDRDIMLHLTRTSAPAHRVTVETCMTRAPRTISPDADLTEAAQIMEDGAVHRLPVVEQGALVGVLSLTDIALVARKEWGRLGTHVAEQQMRHVMEAIAAAEVAQRTCAPAPRA
jgi:CBS domain-containing protein